MIDINLLRQNLDIVKKNYKRRKNPEIMDLLEKTLKIDEKWRGLKGEVDDLRHERNVISENINKLMKEGKKEEAEKIIKKARDISSEAEKKEEKMIDVKKDLDVHLKRLPNLMHESVPYGKDDSENKEVRTWGKIPKFDFEVKNHGEAAEELGVADFEKASEVSGAGFHYLMGDLAQLNMALSQYAMDFMQEKGFKLVIPPLMMRREPYEGVTDLADFENVMYKVKDEDLYLIATSEHPIAASLKDEVLKEDDLPVLIVGFSPCFRKEIGSHGVDTKGLFRTHQFWKVEQFVFCRPEDSWNWHEKLIEYSEEIFKKLDLPHRIVNICTGDLGTVASKKYDLQVWMPRQEDYKEEGSCSNCTDYQARRLNIKFDAKDGSRKLVHTLNNTAIATSRAMVAILENNQNKDGSVTIPEVLRKYMGGKKKIESQ